MRMEKKKQMKIEDDNEVIIGHEKYSVHMLDKKICEHRKVLMTSDHSNLLAIFFAIYDIRKCNACKHICLS